MSIGLSRAAHRVGTIALVGGLSIVVIAYLIITIPNPHTFGFDFKGDLYGGARAILHGHNPYQAGYVAAQAAIARAGGAPNISFAVPVYPPPILLASLPFGLLPFKLAALAFVAISIVAMVLGLRLLGVRDRRCYVLALASLPVMTGIGTGTIDALLVLGVGVAWRWRARLWPPALAVASVVAAKLFLWPLGFWLLATGRRRTAILALGLCGTGILAAWAVIGFDGMAAYPRMVANDSLIFESHGVSLVAALLATGLPVELARAVALAVGASMVAVAWRLARRPDGDRRAFALAVMAGLAAFPIVWWHYLALAFVPIALMSPTLSGLWFVPLLAYLAPSAHANGSLLKMLPYLAIEAIVIVRVCRTEPLRLRRVRSVRFQPGGVSP